MSSYGDKNGEPDLDLFLDGEATGEDRAAAERRLAESSDWQRQARLQQDIDDALRRQFPIASPPATDWFTKEVANREVKSAAATVSRRAAALVVAASLLAMVAGVWWWNTGERTPYFAQRPVAELYHEAIAAGFEPYYECRDPERFARVFRTRQATPLELSPMPEGQRMLGLSYPGGLSRDTTAMLCEVGDQPVMVFVDRLEADFEGAAAHDDPTLNVFREVRDGLVFYEVTPLDVPVMTGHLRIAR